MFPHPKRNRRLWHRPRRIRSRRSLIVMLILFPAVAFAQSGSPFDTGFTALQTLFTGTIAKVASLIAIVVGGYQFAHGEPGSKNVGPSAVQSEVVFPYSVETVAEQPMCAIQRQITGVCNIQNCL